MDNLPDLVTVSLIFFVSMVALAVLARLESDDDDGRPTLGI